MALLLAWVAFVIALAILRPRGGLLREALRILPDALRLIRRLAADNTLPRGVRVRVERRPAGRNDAHPDLFSLPCRLA